jgi:hypothetical protein
MSSSSAPIPVGPPCPRPSDSGHHRAGQAIRGRGSPDGRARSYTDGHRRRRGASRSDRYGIQNHAFVYLWQLLGLWHLVGRRWTLWHGPSSFGPLEDARSATLHLQPCARFASAVAWLSRRSDLPAASATTPASRDPATSVSSNEKQLVAAVPECRRACGAHCRAKRERRVNTVSAAARG